MTVRSLAAIAALLSATPALANAAAARKAIEAQNAKLMEAFNKGDAAAAAGLYDEQAVLMPDWGPEAKGREAIRLAFDAFMKGGLKALSLTVTDVQASGDFAVETGTYRTTIAPQGMPEMNDSGKYLVVWKKSHGKWHLFRDIWNTSAPPSPPPQAQGAPPAAEQPAEKK